MPPEQLLLIRIIKFLRLGHRKDSFGSASGIGGAASGGGRANLAVFKLGLLLKLGFSPKP